MNELVLRDWRSDDEPALVELWARVFGVARGGQTLAWLFRPGPAGQAIRVVAQLGGRAVAHAGVVPMRFRIGQEQVRGAYSVAAMTAPEVQGRGVYRRLGVHLYERLEREGFAFVAGFSNARSEGLMTGPLGRTPIRPFPWCVRPVLPRPGGRGAPGPEAGIVSCEPGDRRLDALWRRAAPAVHVGAVRDGAFAVWRYGTRSDAGYECWLVEQDGPSSPAGGALVLRTLVMRGVRVSFIMDLLFDPSLPEAGDALLRHAVRAARARGARALSALLPPADPARRLFLRSGFVRVPERLHPQLLRFSVRGFGRHAGNGELTDRRHWWLSWSDTDIV